jgi:hypothetical protein
MPRDQRPAGTRLRRARSARRCLFGDIIPPIHYILLAVMRPRPPLLWAVSDSNPIMRCELNRKGQTTCSEGLRAHRDPDIPTVAATGCTGTTISTCGRAQTSFEKMNTGGRTLRYRSPRRTPLVLMTHRPGSVAHVQGSVDSSLRAGCRRFGFGLRPRSSADPSHPWRSSLSRSNSLAQTRSLSPPGVAGWRDFRFPRPPQID